MHRNIPKKNLVSLTFLRNAEKYIKNKKKVADPLLFQKKIMNNNVPPTKKGLPIRCYYADDDDDDDDDDRRKNAREDGPAQLHMKRAKVCAYNPEDDDRDRDRDDDEPGIEHKNVDQMERTPSIRDVHITPTTREVIFKAHRIIAQSLSDWRHKFPCIVRVLPCRWHDNPVEVCINVYHRIGDLSAFPRNVVIDEVLTVPVRFFSASVPTSRLADAKSVPVPSATKKVSRTSNELRAVIERHTPDLFGRFNVTMVSASANGDSDCIVVSVTHKDCLPYLDAPIPTSLDGFPVVVLEREFRFHAAEDEIDSRQRPLTSGSRISVPGLTSDAFGTLGAIVRTDRENYILTCRHVFPLSLNFPSYACLCQPTGDNSVVGQGVVDISHTGSVRETTVDAALVKTNEEVCRSFATSTASWQRAVRKANEAGASLAITGDQPVVGVDIFDVGGVSDTSGYVMMKIGYTTHITFGVMKLCTVVASPTPIIPESVEIDVIFGFYTRRTIAYNHFIVVPVGGAVFSDQGDSGSLVCVVDKDVARPAGLLVGACGAETLVTPLRPVLDRAEAVLKKPVQL